MVEIDLPVAATARFLLAELGLTRKRVLEVGCGSGEVAACLEAAGHIVVGIDANANMILAACGRGIDARRTTWLDFRDTARYDAIVFNGCSRKRNVRWPTAGQSSLVGRSFVARFCKHPKPVHNSRRSRFSRLANDPHGSADQSPFWAPRSIDSR
jgi:SAM-dependent methyltransferase